MFWWYNFTVTTSRLLVICAEHYAWGKVSDLKMCRLIRQGKSYHMHITLSEVEGWGREDPSQHEGQMAASGHITGRRKETLLDYFHSHFYSCLPIAKALCSSQVKKRVNLCNLVLITCPSCLSPKRFVFLFTIRAKKTLGLRHLRFYSLNSGEVSRNPGTILSLLWHSSGHDLTWHLAAQSYRTMYHVLPLEKKGPKPLPWLLCSLNFVSESHALGSLTWCESKVLHSGN